MFTKVLIPTDISSESDKIFEYARGLKGLGLKEVVAIHAVDASSVEIPYLHQEIINRERRILEKGREFFGANTGFKTIVEEGNMTDLKIVEVAERENVSLILMGSHGKAPWEEVLYGSVSEKVGRKASVPVLLLRFDLFKKTSPAALASHIFNKVLFPTDFSPNSDKAFEMVKRLKPKEVMVLHVLKNDEMEKEEREEMEAATRKRFEFMKQDLESTGSKTTAIIRYDNTLDEILRASDDATSVIMASHGKGVLNEWFAGSISLNTARNAPVPVIFIH